MRKRGDREGPDAALVMRGNGLDLSFTALAEDREVSYDRVVRFRPSNASAMYDQGWSFWRTNIKPVGNRYRPLDAPAFSQV